MRPRRITVLLLIPAAIVAGLAVSEGAESDGARVDREGAESDGARLDRGSGAIAATRRLLGRSVQGRPIYAYEVGDPRARRKALVVGCIHGDEPAGIAVARRLGGARTGPRLDLWIVPSINPDGRVAATRQNAHGVDLNRNFPWRWRPLGARGTQQYAGPRALSEPESRIAHSLILRLRPALTVWFHQPLALVDESGGSVAVERRFARLAHLPLRRLTRYPGSAASWQNHRLPKTTAFVVELPPGTPTREQVRLWSAAVLKVAAPRP